jgi:alcohol dehydrogenase
MRAVWLEHGRLELRKLHRPRLRNDFALIRPIYAGICNTDLELQRGYYNFVGIPGHEFVGIVLESQDSKLRGRRVVGEINLACRRCNWCARGLERHCPHRTVLGILNHPGCFAEFLTLPNQNLHVVPDEIPSEFAVFTEPLAAAGEILDQVKIPRGAQVAVLGDGKLGLLVGLLLCRRGYEVHHYGRHKAKLAISRRAGAETHLASEKLPRAHYDWVIDATGSPSGLRQAVQMTRPRGTVFLKSTIHDLVEFDAAPVIVNEITLIGSRCGRFPPALRMLKSQQLDVQPLISEYLPLQDAPRAFERAAQKETLKVLLTFPD